MGLRILLWWIPLHTVVDKCQLPKVGLADLSGSMGSSTTSKQPSEKGLLSFCCHL